MKRYWLAIFWTLLALAVQVGLIALALRMYTLRIRRGSNWEDLAVIATGAIVSVSLARYMRRDSPSEIALQRFAIHCCGAATLIVSALDLIEPFPLALIVLSFLTLFLIYRSALIEHLKENGEAAAEDSARARTSMALVIIAVAVFAFLYRILVRQQLEQTAALFIGLPTVLAMVTLLVVRPRSANTVALKATVLALCISGILLGEGFICILMAAPLFIAVALALSAGTRLLSKYSNRSTTLNSLAVGLLFLPVAMEGVIPELSFNREETVVAEKWLPRTPQQVQASLGVAPDLNRPLPYLLRAGFPTPSASGGSGLAIGSVRSIHFAGGEGKPGEVTVQITEVANDHVVFTTMSDTTHIAHWLAWQSSEVTWKPEHGGTRVQWRLRYRRLLDPAWYFRPWERAAVKKAAEYMIEASANR